MVKQVAIVGAGPSGLLLAHYLMQRQDDYQITIYDRRPDPRSIPFENSRTYPLTLNARGMNALRAIATLEDRIRAAATEIRGTIIHQANGKAKIMARKRPLLALDRTQLVIALLNSLTETYGDRVSLLFDCPCTQVDIVHQTITLEPKMGAIDHSVHPLTAAYDLLIGADGARSVVREAMMQADPSLTCDQQYVPTEYKTLFALRSVPQHIELTQGYIHSWRLKDSGVSVLFVPLSQSSEQAAGVITFPHNYAPLIELNTPQAVTDFFQQQCPSLTPLLADTEIAAFLQRPVARVLTVRCSHYHVGNHALLIGDAAHAVSPSLGQGGNAAMEDVVVLNALLDEYADQWEKVLPAYSDRRKADAHAVLDLSNAALPLSKPLFFELILRMQWSNFLHNLFPKRFPPTMFELLTDTTTPYSEILALYHRWVEKVMRSNHQFLKRH